jgi:hypothetical protein
MTMIDSPNHPGDFTRAIEAFGTCGEAEAGLPSAKKEEGTFTEFINLHQARVTEPPVYDECKGSSPYDCASAGPAEWPSMASRTSQAGADALGCAAYPDMEQARRLPLYPDVAQPRRSESTSAPAVPTVSHTLAPAFLALLVSNTFILLAILVLIITR